MVRGGSVVAGFCRAGGRGGGGAGCDAAGAGRGAVGAEGCAGFAIGGDGAASTGVDLRPNRRRRNSIPTVGPDRASVRWTDSERRCGREDAPGDHLRGSGLMASPRLRREEPWRSYALKAPPRRSTGALLAGCAPTRPLSPLYHRALPSCQPLVGSVSLTGQWKETVRADSSTPRAWPPTLRTNGIDRASHRIEADKPWIDVRSVFPVRVPKPALSSAERLNSNRLRGVFQQLADREGRAHRGVRL
jgi:hypothetical protein